MEPDSVLRASVIVLGVLDLVLIVVCAVAEARVNELRKALASLAGQHQGSSPALETTPSGAGPDARAKEKKLPPRPYSLATQAAVRSKAESLRRAKHERERISAQQGGPA